VAGRPKAATEQRRAMAKARVRAWQRVAVAVLKAVATGPSEVSEGLPERRPALAVVSQALLVLLLAQLQQPLLPRSPLRKRCSREGSLGQLPERSAVRPSTALLRLGVPLRLPLVLRLLELPALLQVPAHLLVKTATLVRMACRQKRAAAKGAEQLVV